MIRFETNVVKKYFEPLDIFVRIRVFTSTEIAQLLQSSPLVNRRSFVELVLNACVIQYNDEIVPRMNLHATPLNALEEKLYELCVDVNPGLDIRKVAVPSAEEGRSELHLLEQGSSSGPVPMERLASLEEELRRRIVGQENAIAAVTRALRKAVVGLRDPRRPISTFFFVGQTGVGKTELARTLSQALFGGLSSLIRIDCSEYALPHEYAKLLGSPPGYVGYDEGGLLSARIAGAGASFVVLFDEVEKSDPKIHDMMLQIMDDGQVTDNKGRPLDFKNAVLILTSNAGAEEIDHLRRRVGFSRSAPRADEVMSEIFEALKLRFKPEFINRVNEIVLFRALTLDDCERIVSTLLDEVKAEAASIPLRLVFTNPVPRFLAERGFKPDWGARELRRTVEREVESPLSDLILEKKVVPGDTVVARICRDRLEFSRN
jgi:ATP-dependent Clp protease ATP-binding subunit ClpC